MFMNWTSEPLQPWQPPQSFPLSSFSRFGRRMALWCTSIGVFFFGIASLFIFDYLSFMITRFFLVMVS